MDLLMTRWVNGFSGLNGTVDGIVIAITEFGVPLLVLFVALQWWSTNDRVHVRHACISAGLTFLAALGVNQVIILFFDRVRPYDAGVTHLIIARSVDASFPSDHATACFAIAAALLLQRLKWRGAIAAAAGFFISVSRVYVGTHYVTDIIGGIAVAMVTSIVIRIVYPEGNRIDRLATALL